MPKMMFIYLFFSVNKFFFCRHSASVIELKNGFCKESDTDGGYFILKNFLIK